MVRFDFVVDEDMELYLMEVSCYAENRLQRCTSHVTIIYWYLTILPELFAVEINFDKRSVINIAFIQLSFLFS